MINPYKINIIIIMDSRCPINKMKKGTFYQINQKDVSRLANRLFQKYDRDASKQVHLKEVKNILKDIYKGIDPKRQFTDEEIKAFFNLLDKNKDGKITEEDFQAITEDYFVNEYKQGAMDIQMLNPELYELNKTQDNKNKPIEEVKKELIKAGNKRFGEEFITSSLESCKKLWTENGGYDINNSYSYDDVFKIFEIMYVKIAYSEKKEKLNKEDFMSLLDKIDYNSDGRISYDEFELYFIRGLLGC